MGALTPDQWNKVVELFHQAREQAPGDRDAFLAEACAGDEALRQEVDTLLREDDDAEPFLEFPPLSQNSPVATPEVVLDGQVDHYTLITKLGEGGMGCVYKGWDHRLDRLVALKFLSPRLVADPEMKERFVLEAKTTSALDHPNICTIYEINETAGGEQYIAMAFYEGQTVRQMIKEGPVPPDKAIGIAAQAGRGLSKAHSLGIVHRDLKPANIIVTHDGLAKVLDFGIAKLDRGLGITRTGMTVGTVAYMSPEQARGRSVDPRTDIWALGVVLYEMLTGRTPFTAENELGVLYAIANEDPKSLDASQRAGWPVGLTDILHRALEKDLASRYQTMDELVGDLLAASGKPEPGSATRRIAEIRKAPTIVVLPFANLSRDPEYEFFGDGLTEELISALSHVEGIQVVASTTAFQFKGKPQDVREIGRQLKVSTALEGSIRASGNKLRIISRLVNVADGYQLWFGRFDRMVDDVVPAQEEIAQAIVSTLKDRLGEERRPLVARPASNPEAYALFLKARHYAGNWSRASLDRGIELYRRALEIDPSFEPALVGLAAAHLLQGFWGFLPPNEAWPKARAAAEEALHRNDNLEGAHAVRAAILAVSDWDWNGAAREFERALAIGGQDPTRLQWYASFYLVPMGRTTEAIEMFRNALQMDPLSPGLHASLAWCLTFVGRTDEAVREAQEGIDLAPASLEGYWSLASASQSRGDQEAAVQVLEKALTIASENSLTLAQLVRSLAAAGRQDHARRLAQRLDELSGRTFVAPSHLAVARIALGQYDEAFDELERACDIREVMILYLRAVPSFQELRDDKRFHALAERIGLPE